MSSYSWPNIDKNDTNGTVTEDSFCAPSELASETVNSAASADLTYITRL